MRSSVPLADGLFMYLDFFGFSEKPFNITPNPRFIFLSKTHREVFAHLLYGIRNHAGFIEVTGEVGTGKTTVLRTLLGQLGGDGYRLAFIFNPSLSALELLRAVNREFGLPNEGLSAGVLLNALNAFLLEENRVGHTVVLVIDEAQNLDPSVLEQIRLISNLETETDKLIQIVLVGQPELGRLLGRVELRQLSQRITVRYHLLGLDFEDTCAYVEHRLGIAGWRGGKLFTLEALRQIHQRARGVPRLINVLCDRALLVAYSEEQREVSSALVKQARRELRRNGEGQRPPWQRLMLLAMTVAVVVLTVALAGRFYKTPSRPSAPIAAPVATVTATTVPATSSLAQALAPLLARWQVAPLTAAQSLALPDDLVAAAAERGLGLLRLRGSLAALLQLDTPALLRLSDPAGVRYVALIAWDGALVDLEGANGVRARLPLARLGERYAGEAYLLWRNPLRIPSSGGGWRDKPELTRLQQLLAAAGLYRGAPSGRYDTQTRQVLLRFQQAHGLTVDGLPGPQTLLALYQAAGSFGLPRLSGHGQEGQ